MRTQLFEAAVRKLRNLAVIDLRGEIDRDAEMALTKAYNDVVQITESTILLNFTNVAYINSTGIALIVSLLARARTDGHQLAVYGLSDHYRKIFEITRLIDFMQLYPDEASVLNADHSEASS